MPIEKYEARDNIMIVMLIYSSEFVIQEDMGYEAIMMAFCRLSIVKQIYIHRT